VSNFWHKDNDESVSEFDLLEDAQEVEAIAEQFASEPVVVEASEEQMEEISEESAYDLDNEEANIVYNVKLRLELARLYDMLINHDLFLNVEASDQAIGIVSNELKHYIVRRLEILLGMRQTTKRTEASDSSLNSVEVGFLKQLAYKGTMGASQQTENVQPVQKPVAQPRLNPLVKQKVSPARTQPVQRQKVQPAAQPSQQKLAVKPKEIVKPKKNNIERPPKRPSGLGRKLTQEEINEAAKRDIEAMGNRKPWAKMTQREKIEETKRVNARHSKQKPANSLPMMTPEQQQMKYMTEEQSRGMAGNQGAKFNTILANMLAAKKNNQ